MTSYIKDPNIQFIFIKIAIVTPITHFIFIKIAIGGGGGRVIIPLYTLFYIFLGRNTSLLSANAGIMVRPFLENHTRRILSHNYDHEFIPGVTGIRFSHNR